MDPRAATAASLSRHGSGIIVGLALPKRDRHYLPAGNYLKRFLKPLAKKAGIPDLTYQALRRTARDALPKAMKERFNNFLDILSVLQNREPSENQLRSPARFHVRSFSQRLKTGAIG